MVTLGGSITEGLTQTHAVENLYGHLIRNFLMYNLYNTPQNINFLNLGIICSYPLLGLFLTESHIRPFKPDFIIVKFVLNESIAILDKQKSNTKLPLSLCCFKHITFLDVHKLKQISQINLTLVHISHPLFQVALAPTHLTDCSEYYLDFSLECHILTILFLQDQSPTFATVTVCVDDLETCYLQGYSQFVNHYPCPMSVIADSNPKLHRITLRITDTDVSKEFYLLGIAYCK